MLDALLALSEAKLGPLWGPALYELVTTLFFIGCITVLHAQVVVLKVHI